MRVITCRSNWLGSLAICALTVSNKSHAALILPDGATVLEAVWPRVRLRPLADVIASHPYYSVHDVSLPDEGAAWSFALEQVGKRYDWRGLIGFFDRSRDWQDEAAWFCSELVAATLRAGGLDCFPNASRVSPQMIAEVLT